MVVEAKALNRISVEFAEVLVTGPEIVRREFNK